MADTLLEGLDAHGRHDANALVRATIARFLDELRKLPADTETPRDRAEKLGLRVLDGGRKS